MNFQKHHLQLGDYTWSSTATTHVNTEPARTPFDSRDGHQVLFMINFFAQSIGSEKITEKNIFALEKLIRDLPEELKSEKSVFNFLCGQYLYHSV